MAHNLNWRGTMEELNLDTVLRHLPPCEAQRFLFKRLDGKTLKHARCVNKLWQSLVDPLMEFHLELSDISKLYVEGFGSDRPVKAVSATSFRGKYPQGGISVDANMLRVTVSVLDGNDSYQAFRHKRKSNKRDSRNVGITQFNFRRLIQDFQYVAKLHIASLAVKTFRNPKLLSKIHLPNVKEMIITFFDGGFHQLIPFMRNHFPTLKCVNIANVAESRKDRPVIYSWIYGFVANHYKSIEDVTLIFPEGMIEDDDEDDDEALVIARNVSSHLRRDHRMPQQLYELAKKKLQKMNLKKFILDMSMLEGHTGRYDMGLCVLQSQINLSELHLDNLHVKDVGLWRKMGTMLEKLSGTLVSLSLGGCFCGPNSPPGTHAFSCTWVKNCTKLKELEMIICGLIVTSVVDLPKDSLRLLNLGHMLTQEQIEHIILNLVNLETWILPQRGSLVNPFIPKVSLYLFEAILHLPKLTKLNLSLESSDKEKILEFVASEEGIRLCGHACLMEDERNGNLSFHINRDTFFREHSNLKTWMAANRKDPLVEFGQGDLLEYVIRNFFQRGIDDFEVLGEHGGEDDDDDADVEFMRFINIII